MSKKLLLNILKFLIIIIIISFSSENKNSEGKYLRNLELTLSDIIEFPIGSLPGEINTIPVSSNSTSITTPSTTSDNSTIIPLKKAKSSSGLSTGGIIAIVIPCVAALIAVGAVAALCRSAPTPPIQQDVPVNYMEGSLDKFTSPTQEVVVQQPPPVQEIPVQPVQMVQGVPVFDQGIPVQNMAHQIGPVEHHVIHVPEPNAI